MKSPIPQSNPTETGKIFELFSLLIKSLILFLFVYNLSFQVEPRLTSGRLVVLVLSLYYIRPLLAFLPQLKRHFVFICVFLLLLFYSYFRASMNFDEDKIQASRFFWFLVFCIWSPVLFLFLFHGSVQRFFQCYLICSLIQSCFVFLNLINADFRNWTYNTLSAGGNIDVLESIRSVGLSNGGGALLSLQLALGVFSSLWLVDCAKSLWTRSFYALSGLVVYGATLPVGRTGQLVSLFMAAAYIIYLFLTPSKYLHLIRLTAILLIAGAACLPLLNYVLSEAIIDVEFLKRWAFELFLTGDAQAYNAFLADFNYAPEYTTSWFLFGSGKVIHPDGLPFGGTDSGYTNILYAIGFPLTLLFYTTFAAYLFWLAKPLKGLNYWAVVILSAVCFAVEIKEPFIFKYTHPFFIIALLFCSRSSIEQSKSPDSVFSQKCIPETTGCRNAGVGTSDERPRATESRHRHFPSAFNFQTQMRLMCTSAHFCYLIRGESVLGFRRRSLAFYSLKSQLH